MKQEHIIEHIDEIKQIASEINLFSAGRKGRIRAQLPLFTEKENRQIGRKIEKCCKTNSRSQRRITGKVVIAILAAMLLITVISSIVEPGAWNILLLYVGSPLIILLSVKLYRLHKTRMSLKALAHELELKLG